MPSIREIRRYEDAEHTFVSVLLEDASAGDVLAVQVPQLGRIVRVRAKSDGGDTLPRFVDMATPPVGAYGLDELGETPCDAAEELDTITSIPYVMGSRKLGIDPGGDVSNDNVRVDLWIVNSWRGV